MKRKLTEGEKLADRSYMALQKVVTDFTNRGFVSSTTAYRARRVRDAIDARKAALAAR